jgi:hypothetical protein
MEDVVNAPTEQASGLFVEKVKLCVNIVALSFLIGKKVTVDQVTDFITSGGLNLTMSQVHASYTTLKSDECLGEHLNDIGVEVAGC